MRAFLSPAEARLKDQGWAGEELEELRIVKIQIGQPSSERRQDRFSKYYQKRKKGYLLVEKIESTSIQVQDRSSTLLSSTRLGYDACAGVETESDFYECNSRNHKGTVSGVQLPCHPVWEQAISSLELGPWQSLHLDSGFHLLDADPLERIDHKCC